jgi:hypothetical protein
LKKLATSALVLAATLAVAAPAAANDHSWGGYHWSVTATSFTVNLDNNLTTPGWREIGAASAADWSQASVLDAVLSGPLVDNKRCKASSGRVEVCNGKYGRNGWLGIAQVWVSGGHIVQAVAKMNDTYLATGYSDVNRQHVLCQEVGHTFGLDHTSEDGSNDGTCMDYWRELGNPSPNQGDYAMLSAIYDHVHTSSTLALSAATAPASGKAVRLRDDLYVENQGFGRRLYTFVTWVDHDAARSAPDDHAPE